MMMKTLAMTPFAMQEYHRRKVAKVLIQLQSKN